MYADVSSTLVDRLPLFHPAPVVDQLPQILHRMPDRFHAVGKAARQNLSVPRLMRYRHSQSVWMVAVSSSAPLEIVGNISIITMNFANPKPGHCAATGKIAMSAGSVAKVIGIVLGQR